MFQVIQVCIRAAKARQEVEEIMAWSQAIGRQVLQVARDLRGASEAGL